MGIQNHLIEYIITDHGSAETIIKVGSSFTRPLKIRRLVIDELLDIIDNNYKSGSIEEGFNVLLWLSLMILSYYTIKKKRPYPFFPW